MGIAERPHDIPAVLGEIAPALADAGIHALGIALGRPGVLGVGVALRGVLLENEVDHAGDRIGAVHRGGAIQQDFHALDGIQRDGLDGGGETAAERVVERRRGGRTPSIRTSVYLDGNACRAAVVLPWPLPFTPVDEATKFCTWGSCWIRSVAVVAPLCSMYWRSSVSTGRAPSDLRAQDARARDDDAFRLRQDSRRGRDE